MAFDHADSYVLPVSVRMQRRGQSEIQLLDGKGRLCREPQARYTVSVDV